MMLPFATLTNFAAPPSGCDKGDFLGLLPWYHYIPADRFNKAPDCSIIKFNLLGSDSDIPLILLAVVDDLLRIIGIVAVAFIIIGAAQLITSQGNPESTAHARGTIINALIGLFIALVAVAFVGFLGRQLGK